MNRPTHALLLTLLFASGVALAPAQEIVLPVDPPAAATPPERAATAIESLAATGDHKRLLEALEAAGLSGTLSSLSPLTVFAPTDSAFSSSTYMSFSDLLKEENRGRLGDLLRYHIVAGSIDTATLDARIESGNDGRVVLTTVGGGKLVVQRSAGEYIITDATNHTARIVVADVYQRNGVVQVVDAVLRPNNPP
jgi:uncharacterized surface protein with fasciclin (FAS1) repeats